MPLVNNNEQEIQQLEENVAELQLNMNITNVSISTLQSDMRTAQSDIRNSQNIINSTQTDVNTLAGLVAVNANNILQQNGKISSLQGKIATLEQGVTTVISRTDSLDQRVTVLEKSPSGGVSPELINATISPVQDVFFHGESEYKNRVDLRYFKNLQNEHDNLQVLMIKSTNDEMPKIYSYSEKQNGWHEGYESYIVLKSNDVVNSVHFLNDEQNYLLNNFLDNLSFGIWGFNLGLDDSYNRDGYVLPFVGETENARIFYFWNDTISNVSGHYVVNVVNNNYTIIKNGVTIRSGDIRGDFLVKISEINLAIILPQLPENCSFDFNLQSIAPVNSRILMIHGMLLEDNPNYYGNYNFQYEITNSTLTVNFPDGTSEAYSDVHRDPIMWYQHGTYKFAFMLRYNEDYLDVYSFNFNFNGESTEYFDGIQIQSSDGDSTLYGYYNPADIGAITDFHINYDTTYFYLNGAPYSYSEFFSTSNPMMLFWAGKVQQYNGANFNFAIN